MVELVHEVRHPHAAVFDGRDAQRGEAVEEPVAHERGHGVGDLTLVGGGHAERRGIGMLRIAPDGSQLAT